MEIEKLYEVFLQSRKISTDTRKIEPGSIFFALKGPNFNANAFADEALVKGATLAVIDDATFQREGKTFLVSDTLLALQNLARHHRSHLKIPVIGLTGSNGKTTSKELLNAVLAKKFRTFATKGNLNNHIGVPLSVLSIDDSVEVAVIEMGANHVGEIALLCSIANPTHGFITNIGKAHIGTFGGFENIIRGKSELFQYLIGHNGTAFINSQNSILSNMTKRFKNPVLYPSVGDYYHCRLVSADPHVVIEAGDGERIVTQMIGSYNFENMAVALCIGKYFGVGAPEANRAIADYVPGSMRSQIVKKDTNTIILDAYNANPSSMEAAINNLAGMEAKRKVVILGDMYELEGETASEHRRIGSLLQEKKINEAYLCGPLMKEAQETFPLGKFFQSKDELILELKNNPIRNALILIKGSRGMAMEKVVEVI